MRLFTAMATLLWKTFTTDIGQMQRWSHHNPMWWLAL